MWTVVSDLPARDLATTEDDKVLKYLSKHVLFLFHLFVQNHTVGHKHVVIYVFRAEDYVV